MIIFSMGLFSCLFSSDAKERLAKRFSVDGVFNYTSLLLSQEDDMLYVGAREALFALSLSDISKTKLQKNVNRYLRVKYLYLYSYLLFVCCFCFAPHHTYRSFVYILI